MSARTVTRTIDVDAAPERVLEAIGDPRRIPDWAPAFADSIEKTEIGWTAIKDNHQFSIRIAIDPATGCFDILREIAPGEQGGLFMRVLPRPGAGSVVVATIPIVPTSSPERTSSILADELDRIATALCSLKCAGEGILYPIRRAFRDLKDGFRLLLLRRLCRQICVKMAMYCPL